MKKLFSTRTSDNAFAFAMLVLRVGAGFLMISGTDARRVNKPRIKKTAQKNSANMVSAMEVVGP